jgi:hypothetical protein
VKTAFLSPFLLLLLTACGTERVVERPVIHEVVRVEWREIPADLTARCPKSEIPDSLTFGQAVELWAEDRAAIEQCNGKLAGIESLGADE